MTWRTARLVTPSQARAQRVPSMQASRARRNACAAALEAFRAGGSAPRVMWPLRTMRRPKNKAGLDLIRIRLAVWGTAALNALAGSRPLLLP
jgi:hypothetical protein